jgi:hypothetical protein
VSPEHLLQQKLASDPNANPAQVAAVNKQVQKPVGPATTTVMKQLSIQGATKYVH